MVSSFSSGSFRLNNNRTRVQRSNFRFQHLHKSQLLIQKDQQKTTHVIHTAPAVEPLAQDLQTAVEAVLWRASLQAQGASW